MMNWYKDTGKEILLEIEPKQLTQVNKITDDVYPKELDHGRFGKLLINNKITVDNATTVILATPKGMAGHRNRLILSLGCV